MAFLSYVTVWYTTGLGLAHGDDSSETVSEVTCLHLLKASVYLKVSVALDMFADLIL